MSERDAVIAEAVEPKPDLPSEEEAGEMLMDYISGTRFYSPGRAWETVFIYDHGDIAELLPRTFDSVPTWESDGIVLEWAQGQSVSTRNKFYYEIGSKIKEDHGGTPFALAMFLENYKPGMYAKALLEARDDI